MEGPVLSAGRLKREQRAACSLRICAKIGHAAWRAARDRIRPGGLFISDNTLWSGRVTGSADAPDERPALTAAIHEMNQAVAADREYLSTILPIRDGVTIALRSG